MKYERIYLKSYESGGRAGEGEPGFFGSFRNDYEELHEFLHPSWAGVMGAFGTIYKENFRFELRGQSRSLKIEIGLYPFMACLQAFGEYYNDLSPLIQDMNRYFESREVERVSPGRP